MRLATLLGLALSLALGAGAGGSAVPPPVGLIAFVRENPTRTDINAGVDLWVVRTDGDGARKVVGTSGWDEYPAWSPDGRRIAFDRALYDRDEAVKTIDVWTVGADGRGRRNVTHDGSAALPAWSPGGTALAFVRGDGVFVVNPDGSTRRHVGRRADPTEPAWSPDGGRVAFTTPGEVWVASPKGAGQRRLATGASSDTRAAWSHDGRLLSYAGRNGTTLGVFTVKLTGGRPGCSRASTRRRSGLPTGAASRSSTGYPPAGRDLPGPARRPGEARLTRGVDTAPAWSPDSRRIAFRRGLLVGDIYVVSIDGSHPRDLTRTPRLDERQPAWQPR